MHAVSAPTPRQAPRRHVPACAALFALAGLLASGCGGSGHEQTKGAAAESQEVLLQPVGAPGPDPFTPSTATAESAPVQPPVPNRTGRGIRTIAAATPGLYGGTNRLGSCDVERQVNLLTTDDAKSRAFAQASGVGQETLPQFLRALTPVVLRADTRVTDHGFRDGGPAGYQAVLQAGSAVLVDEHGMPRVRCACGNPIGAPRAAKGDPVLKGDQWNGYQANQVTVIEPAAQVLTHLLIVNTADNTWIERRIGDDGAQDRTPKVVPRFDPAEGIPNGPLTPNTPSSSDPCAGGAAGRGGPERTGPRAAPPAPPAGPPADLPETAPPTDPPTSDVPYEQLPPIEAPGEAPADGTADPLNEAPNDVQSDVQGDVQNDMRNGVPGEAQVAPAPRGGVPHAGPPSAALPSADPQTDPLADLPEDAPAAPSSDVPYEQLPPLDVPPAGPLDGPLDVPPAGPPAADPPSAAAPSTPCPSESGAANGPATAPGVPPAPQANPQRPPAEQRPQAPDAPSDVPTDLAPEAPDLPLSPDDELVDPSVPLDPDGFPMDEETMDSGQYLESA
ncbi:DUF6777 domain-containing protein [Streptomyces sp. NPDC048606]|uniref:DUF6777 domain-containing protein n=1 Tax=Streptomyces sp. NPDC048606 TaxID=3154726 RepID=UPI00342743DD